MMTNSPEIALEWREFPPLSDPQGFGGPAAAVLDDQIVVAGGSNFSIPMWEGGVKNWSDRIFLLDPVSGQWRDGGRLPRPLGFPVSASLPGEVFVVGGQDGGSVFRSVLRLTGKGDGIGVEETAFPLPRPLTMAAGAVVDGVLYLAGGLEAVDATKPSHVFLALDLSEGSREWRELPAWPGAARCLAAAASRGGEFILAGGLTRLSNLAPDAFSSEVFAYRPGEGWRELPALAHASSAPASPMPVAEDGTLILVGGADGKQLGLDPSTKPNLPRRVQILAPDADEWRVAGEAPFGRVTLQTCRWNDGWFFPSGESSPGVRSPRIWRMTVAPKPPGHGGDLGQSQS